MAWLLAGLCVVTSLMWLLMLGPWTTREPSYQGKPVSVWFMEYAFTSNAMFVSPQTLGVRVQPDGGMVLMQRNAAGSVVMLTAPTNPVARAAWLQRQMSSSREPPRDPAWEALQALGSNAVPHLVSQLRGIPFNQTYSRVFTNLPVLMQKKLPNPQTKQQLRIRALNTLSKLGDPARSATPSVLPLLKDRDRALRFAVLEALRGMHVERRAITLVLLQLGEQRRYLDVVEIAAQTGWEGDDMARLLGTILKSPDPALRRQAISLLERSGPAAAPELEAVTLALSDADPEVRYLAARTVEAIGANSPEITHALLSLLEDTNIMVRTVARRTLLKIVPEAIPPVEAVSP